MSARPATSVVSLSAIARLCALLTFSATTLASQAAPTVAPAPNDARKIGVVSQLVTGSTIRVATSDRVVLEGRYARLENESLVLYSAAGRDAPRIPLRQIDTLWIRARDSGKGIVNGALIGGALGAVGVGLVAYGVTHSTGDACNCGTVVVGTIGVSALLGGVLGAAIGWPNWRQRWPQTPN